jgi:ECF sigma factor
MCDPFCLDLAGGLYMSGNIRSMHRDHFPAVFARSGVTELLLAWNTGDRTALDRLMPLVYHELQQLARQYMRSESPGHSLQPTALVNEAYIRQVNQQRVD